MKYLILPIIKFYKRFISKGTNACCTFYPTCSVYAMIAIEEWGGIVGSIMAFARLIRCNPLSKGGYDPVKRCRYKHRYTI